MEFNHRINPAELHTFEQHWPIIQPILRSLISNQPINKEEWQDLFYHVHMVCSWDERGCLKLLESLEFELFNSFMLKTKLKLVSLSNEIAQQRLKEYVTCWNEFSELSYKLPVAFQQLDSASKQLKSHKQVKIEISYNCESTVRNLLFKLWDQHILNIIAESLQDSAIILASAERSGFIIDTHLIVLLRESLVCIDNYNEMRHVRIKTLKQKVDAQSHSYDPYMSRFRTIYIQELEIFYPSKASATFSGNGLMNYINWALKKLDVEQYNAQLYLGSNSTKTITRITEVCVNALVSRFAEEVLSECSQYFYGSTTKNEDMRLIFAFLSSAGSPFVEIFLDIWSEHILKSNLSFAIPPAPFNSNECKQYVDKLIESYHIYKEIVRYSLNDDVRAVQVLDEAFQIIVNGRTKPEFNNESRSAELLAFHCDLLLRRTATNRKSTSNEVTESLKKALLIVRFVKDKDNFIKIHKIHLTRRLLLNTTIGIEKEEQFVELLDKVCGSEYTNEISRMFKDYRISSDLKDQYKKTMVTDFSQENISNNNYNNNNNNSIQVLTTKIQADINIQNHSKDVDVVDIKVLNPDVWPKSKDKLGVYNSSKGSNLMLTSFENFYRNKYPGRKLEWCPQFSTGTLTFTTKKGKFDLEVTLAQYSILISFNSKSLECQTFEDLQLESNLSQNELRRALWSLVSNSRLKQQILICHPESRSINDIDRKTNKFSINQNFMVNKNGELKSNGSVSLIGRLFI